MKIALLVLLTACTTTTDGSTEPDASVPTPDALVFDSYCTAHVSMPAAGGPEGSCLTTVTIDVVCPAGIVQAYNRILIGWARLVAPTGVALVETSYRCNEAVSATFSTPCASPITGAAGFQDPIRGGDLYMDQGVLCDANSEVP